eukprot:2938764-Pleurochrysis_carterae.AAC.1
MAGVYPAFLGDVALVRRALRVGLVADNAFIVLCLALFDAAVDVLLTSSVLRLVLVRNQGVVVASVAGVVLFLVAFGLGALWPRSGRSCFTIA